jgi:hypothetical protein
MTRKKRQFLCDNGNVAKEKNVDCDRRSFLKAGHSVGFFLGWPSWKENTGFGRNLLKD